MARDNTRQHLSGMQGKVVDTGSVSFAGTATTVSINTPLTTIESINFGSDTAATDLGSIIITTPSLSSVYTYEVTGGAVTVTRSDTTSNAVLFYQFVGID